MRVDRELVAELRRKKSWSQDELATAAAVNLRTIQRMENLGAASLQTLKSVASALEVRSEELQPLEGSTSRPHRRRVAAALGIRRRAALRIGSLPLYDIAIGPDVERGELRGHAKGVIAVGDRATGVFAVGGLATGGVAIGGLSAGLVSIGGLSIGALAAFGGLAIGALAIGGAAGGGAAIGGAAAGYYSCGGAAMGAHVANSTRRDASVDEFLHRYGLSALCPEGVHFAGVN